MLVRAFLLPAAVLMTSSFAEASPIRECALCRSYLSGAFEVPSLWWSASCKNSNGYFGYEATKGETGEVTGYNTWSLFLVKQLEGANLHEWYRVNIFTRWLAATKQTVILVFDAPQPIRVCLPTPLLSRLEPQHNDDPFWLYVPLMDEIAHLQDLSVWTVRDRVREMETKRTPPGKPAPNYRSLHDMARHAIHIIETLDVTEKTMTSLLAAHSDFMTHNVEATDVSQAIHRRLLFYEHLLSSLRHRSASNKERLLNEIRLTFSMVAEYDSGISVKIGQAAQSDSAAMKTVAFVTLTFLPPTFISAIFSMSFFNYDADTGRWSMSEKLWVYWAFAIPTTLITSLLWYTWHKIHPPALIEADQRPKHERLALGLLPAGMFRKGGAIV